MKLLLIKHVSRLKDACWTGWDISWLPLDQWYEVDCTLSGGTDELIKKFYSIKTNSGTIGWIPEDVFLTQDEWREEQLNKIIT
jgi:hypothetical protein